MFCSKLFGFPFIPELFLGNFLIKHLSTMKTSTGKYANSRRNFLRKITVAPLAAVSFAALGKPEALSFHSLPLVDTADEKYWAMVQKQFTVPENLIMMNAANLCPSPFSINEQLFDLMIKLGRDVSFQFRDNLTVRRSKALESFSEFVGVKKNEIGITRNTSESNCAIVNGLDLQAGDEVIIWDQNHPSNNAAWLTRAKRIGFKVIKITLPAQPQSITDLLDPFDKAITSKTKVIAFSHISNTTGMALPAKEICALARSKKILSMVDGAQSLGMLNLDLKDIGCDFYTSSTHKWLMGPLENGILYVREENIASVWPNIVGGGWKDTGQTVDEKICVLGQRNETTPAVLPDILEFHKHIGRKRIEERVIALNTYIKEQIQLHIPKATFVTPLSPKFSGGIVIVNFPGRDPKEIYLKLYDVHGIATANAGGVRLSPHIYNTKADIDRVVSALKSLA
jgi:isopenicillin-N epimerase